MMLATRKSDSISDKTNLSAKYFVRRIQEECCDEHLSPSPDQFEEGKMRYFKRALYLLIYYEFWLGNEAPRYLQRKSSDSFSTDPHHKVRKATCMGKLHSLSFYSVSFQDLLEGFNQVLLHFCSLGYPLNMVEKVYFKRALKTEKQKWEFLGKWIMKMRMK
jgi:hypothetical protein